MSLFYAHKVHNSYKYSHSGACLLKQLPRLMIEQQKTISLISSVFQLVFHSGIFFSLQFQNRKICRSLHKLNGIFCYFERKRDGNTNRQIVKVKDENKVILFSHFA